MKRKATVTLGDRTWTGTFDADQQLHGKGRITERGQIVSTGMYDGGKLLHGWEVCECTDAKRAMLLSLRGTFVNGELTEGRQSFEVGSTQPFSQRLRLVTEGRFDPDGELHGQGVETISVVERDGCLQCCQTTSGRFEGGLIVCDADMTTTRGGMFPRMIDRILDRRSVIWDLRACCR